MSGIPPDVACGLQEPITALLLATAGLAATLERLCDPELADAAREEKTELLYSDMEDVRLALVAFADFVMADGQTAPVAPVVDVAPTRWRRDGPVGGSGQAARRDSPGTGQPTLSS